MFTILKLLGYSMLAVSAASHGEIVGTIGYGVILIYYYLTRDKKQTSRRTADD